MHRKTRDEHPEFKYLHTESNRFNMNIGILMIQKKKKKVLKHSQPSQKAFSLYRPTLSQIKSHCIYSFAEESVRCKFFSLIRTFIYINSMKDLMLVSCINANVA